MNTRSSVTCSVLFFTFIAVLASASSLRAQCQAICGPILVPKTFGCSSPGCTSVTTVMWPEDPWSTTQEAFCRTVYCCTAAIPTWYFNFTNCVAPIKGGDTTAAQEQSQTYLFVRGCDGGYRLTAFATGS